MAGNKAKKKKQKKVKKHPKFWLGVKVFMLMFLVTILVVGIAFYVKYGRDIFKMQDEAIQIVKNSTAETFRDSETTIAYNSKGKQIAVLKGDKDSYYMSIDQTRGELSVPSGYRFKIRERLAREQVRLHSSLPEMYFSIWIKPMKERLKKYLLPWSWKRNIQRIRSWNFI